jgi:CRP/FNR family transcriptional regulator, cyclic AMP receptor protein
MSEQLSTEALLRRVPLFSGLGDRELGVLARIARQRHFAAGADIVRQGDNGIGVYLLVHGRARVLRQTTQGRVRELNEIDTGGVFGELALLDEAPRMATVQAIEPCTCLVLPRWEFLARLRSDGELATKLLQELARRFHSLSRAID